MKEQRKDILIQKLKRAEKSDEAVVYYQEAKKAENMYFGIA